MKNSKLIVGLASLLKVDKDVIISNLENEAGDDGVIKDFLQKNNVFTLDDVAKIKTNSKAEALAELEKATEFPSAIYNRVKGLALEKVEKEAAKKFGVEKWDNFDDLVSKIATKGKGVDGDKEAQIELLKKSLQEKDAEIQSKVTEVESKYTNDFVNRDFKLASDNLRLAGDDDKTIENQKTLINGAFKNQFKLSYKEGKTIVLDAENKPIVDKLGDVMPVFDVYKNFAVTHGAKLKEIDAGGRGDGSSSTESKTNFKGKTFAEVSAAKGVKPNTDEADKLYAEWQAANKN
jgi:hypothetical protein